ncbi:MAG: DUF2851 family protein [Porphyromonas sp.]|nr:DUF2851 family protein [Porphyromonas sp.]
MKEEILHYIWENQLYDLVTLDGKPVQVLSSGRRNYSDGPDFLLAKVMIDGITWVGSIEIHNCASEWYRHGHERDPLYNAVVLQVVLEADKEVSDSSGRVVPTAEFHLSKDMLTQLSKLQMANLSLRCMPEMMSLEPNQRDVIIHSLLPQRLDRKLAELRARTNDNHLNTIFFYTLVRYLGALKNNDAMEQVARSIRYSYLKKHSDDLTALEAILLGQAGLISDTPRDSYEAELLGEYQFYREKFALTPASSIHFKRLRVRPVSYPTRRLAIAAQIIHHEEELLDAMQGGDTGRLRRVLATPPSEYWRHHYDFGHHSDRPMGGIGEQTIDSLIINAIVPTAYHYAEQRGDNDGMKKALALLDQLPAESNRIIALFKQNGITPESARDTQSLLELYQSYCTPYRCFNCPLATALFQTLRS